MSTYDMERDGYNDEIVIGEFGGSDTIRQLFFSVHDEHCEQANGSDSWLETVVDIEINKRHMDIEDITYLYTLEIPPWDARALAAKLVQAAEYAEKRTVLNAKKSLGLVE
jgi:hypothetical protein